MRENYYHFPKNSNCPNYRKSDAPKLSPAERKAECEF